MSAAKHTPGPWFVQAGLVAAQDEHSAATTIASVNPPWGMPLRDAQERHQANLALVAAAPDLLAACDQALVACLPGASDEQRRAAWNACIKAVAKATGGAL